MDEPINARQYAMPLRVYWEDTDAGGVVFYANYLKFMERCRTEWLRHLGVEQLQLQADTGVVFVVLDVNIRYKKSARLDDLLTVDVSLLEQRAASIVVRQTVRNGDALLAESTVRIGCVEQASWKPCRLPDSVARVLMTV
ncbi:tol-pal system-associated acyl-CoA thioesterase [Curvibacter sp. CHRR-16]|uniref:tol-pal system-associated acyl-CoA thioesterase n=1 Tax=Curvibacter sp. CHRR-16 TaxID=2835872 RepID=UPI001BDB5F7B|nr:tol-pal system-associated acyl-CoA thioesterase [Curvibacter sp. CHRR-16]MBT0571198.1 tol-pal system-associated acyl-CoA thioesterase [Curvibacter sp. CHRR-16]